MSQNMFNTNPEPIKNILDSLNLNNINYGDIAIEERFIAGPNRICCLQSCL